MTESVDEWIRKGGKIEIVPQDARTTREPRAVPRDWEERVNPIHCQPGKRVNPKPGLGD